MNERLCSQPDSATPMCRRVAPKIVLLVAVMLGVMDREALAQAATAPVWVIGAPNMSPAGTLVQAWPGASPEATAVSVLSAPPGSRGLLLTVFAEDIATRDTLSVVRGSGKRRTVVAVASPWFDAGAIAVRARTSSWLGRFTAAGGTADFVVIRCAASAPVQRFASSWSAIAADPRSAALVRQLGVKDLSARTVGMPGFAARWKSVSDARLAAAIDSSIGAEVRSRFPRAQIVLDAPRLGPEANSASGSAGLRTIAIEDRSGAASFGQALSRLSANGRWAAMIHEPSARPAASGPAVALGWREAVFHAALRTSAPVVVSATSLQPADIGAIIDAARELRGQAPGQQTFAPAPLAGTALGAGVQLASAARVGASLLVRVTTDHDVRALCVTLADGNIIRELVSEGDGGAWIALGQADRAIRIDACSPAESPVSPAVATAMPVAPAWAVLYDSIPSVPATSPVPSARSYMLVGQYDCDPEIARTGVIDPARVAAQVDRLIAAGKGSEYGVLDFEDPFDHLWESGTADPRYGPALQSMIATIRHLKERYPGIKWTYYGLPRVKYWLPEGEWAELSQPQREAVFARSVAPILPLMAEMDWFNPGVYDVYERAMGMPTTRTPRVDAEAAWRRANVEAIKWHFASRGLEAPPVIPMVCPWFQGGGFATEMRPVPASEFLEEQVRPVAAAGAAGVAIWGGMRYALYVARWTAPHPSSAFLELRDRIRSAFVRDYLGGRTVADSEWGDPSVATTIGTGLNETMFAALLAGDAARP